MAGYWIGASLIVIFALTVFALNDFSGPLQWVAFLSAVGVAVAILVQGYRRRKQRRQ